MQQLFDNVPQMRAQFGLANFYSAGPRPMRVNKSQNVAEALGKGQVDFQFALIDYRNGNEQIKTKVMSHKEAASKNALLKGSGFAWARLGY